MNPNNSQDMSPEEAKASLGIATNLMGQLMPQAPEEEMASEPVEEAPEMQQKPLREQYSQEESVDVEALTEIKDEISSLREEIEEALNDDNEQEETSNSTEEA